MVRPKPEKEWVRFQVPKIVGETVWQRANAMVSERGRGRGKEGKAIQALLRNRIFCPRCGRAMVVRRYKRQDERTYYYCSRYFRPRTDRHCSYCRFMPSIWWDDHVWDAVCALLEDDAWLERGVSSMQSGNGSTSKMIGLQEQKISQAKGKITRIRDGYERGIYGIEEAQRRIKEHEGIVHKAELETRKLQKRMASPEASQVDLEIFRNRLDSLRAKNLEKATFEEKREVMVKLGIRVYPSEDLKSVRIACGVNVSLDGDPGSDGNDDCRKVLIGSPSWIRTNNLAVNSRPLYR